MTISSSRQRCHSLSRRLISFLLLVLAMIRPASGQSGTVVVSDSFDRDNSTVLGSADTGQSWSMHAGIASVQSGVAQLGDGFVLASLDSGLSTGTVEARLGTLANEFWLIVRLSDNANYWRFGRWQGGAYQLQKIQNNGLGSPQVQTLATVFPQTSDILSCNFLHAGLECAVSGIAVVNTSDPFASEATRVGLSGYVASTATFDDFLVSAPPAEPNLIVGLSGPVSSYSGVGLTWTATVQNVGTVAAVATELHVQPPVGHPNLAFQGASCTPETGLYRCSLGNLPPQEAVTVMIDLAYVYEVPSVTLTATAPVVIGETATAENTASFTTRLRPAMPSDTVAFDTFDLPNGTVPANAVTGQPWNYHYQALSIQQGQAAPGDGFVLASLEPGSPPTGVRVIVSEPSSEFWMIIRFENSSNYWRFGRWHQQTYQLQQVANNAVVTSAVANHASVTPASGDVLACSTAAAALSCLVNGLTVASTTSTVGGTASRVGLSGYDASLARFDDFIVTGPPPVPDVSVILVGPGLVYGNSNAIWTATVRNLSSVLVAQSVEVLLSPAASVNQVEIPGFACVAEGLSWRCPVGSLAPGATIPVNVHGTTPASGTIMFTASVPIQTDEVNTTDNNASLATSVRPAIPADPLFFDSFDRPNSNALGTATTGHVWTAHAPGFAIRSGQAAPGDGFSLASVDTGESILDTTVSLIDLSQEFWLVVRLQDGQNYWRFGRSGGGTYRLQLVNAGALANPALEVVETVTPAPGDVLNCSANESGLTCSVNGVQVVHTADATGKLATRIGLSGYQAGNARFEDLVVVGPPAIPNPAVTVNAPNHVLVGVPHTVEVTVRNAGRAASDSGTVVVTIPSSVDVGSMPASCSTQSSTISCSLPALAPSAAQAFEFQLSSSDPVLHSGGAIVSVNGDPVSDDNFASWETSAHPSGASWIVDGFDRANTTVGLGTAPSQQPWSSLSPGFRILNGTAQADSSGALAVIDSGYAFGTLEVVLGSNAATTAIVFRAQDASNYYRVAADQSGFYALRKIINGVAYPLDLGHTRASLVPTQGDVVRIATRPDDSVFVTVNGEHVMDQGDTALMFATGWGLASVGGSATANDFVLNPRIEGNAILDNFSTSDGSTLWRPTTGVKYTWQPGFAWVSLGGQARSTSDIYSYTWIDNSTELASVEARITAQGAGAWVIFRYDEFVDTYFRFGQTAGSYTVEFMDNRSVIAFPVALQTLASPVPQAGDVLRVHQLLDGTVECSVNGVLTHRFVDGATNARWTLHGLAAEGSQAAFDDFKVTP